MPEMLPDFILKPHTWKPYGVYLYIRENRIAFCPVKVPIHLCCANGPKRHVIRLFPGLAECFSLALSIKGIYSDT